MFDRSNKNKITKVFNKSHSFTFKMLILQDFTVRNHEGLPNENPKFCQHKLKRMLCFILIENLQTGFTLLP